MKRSNEDVAPGRGVYIRRLGSQNFEFQYCFGFSEILIFLGYEDFVDIFLGHHKIGLYLGFISMHFRVFS